MNLQEPCALVVAHPGHELRLYGWMHRAMPRLSILTTGSRSGTAKDRLDASRRLAEEAGCGIGPFFGVIADRDFYELLRLGDAGLLQEYTDALRESFCKNKTRLVIVDAWQMYNVAHDIVHVMARVAATEAAAILGSNIEVLEYAVVPTTLAYQTVLAAPLIDEQLCDAIAQRKLAAIHAYPDVKDEFDEILQHEGASALRHEILRPTRPLDSLAPPPGTTPQYEQFGEQRVAAGLYQDVLRWRHARPVQQKLLDRLNRFR